MKRMIKFNDYKDCFFKNEIIPEQRLKSEAQ